MLLAQHLSPAQEHNCRRQLREARKELLGGQPELEGQLCKLFGATSIHHESPLMAHGWTRPIDAEIYRIVARMIPQGERIAILEVGAGSTWGGRNKNFGVPGLARIIKHAFPHQVMVTISDRIQGFDIFFVSTTGELVHRPYRDDRPPKLLSPSPLCTDGTLIPASTPFIQLSMAADAEFASWISTQEREFDVTLSNGKNPLFIRPQLDNEVEALLFGVRALPGVDYLNLTDSLLQKEERSRYDLIIGRHLLPQYLPSRLQRLQENFPTELQECSHNYFVHFDRCFFGDNNYADLVFRHHKHL